MLAREFDDAVLADHVHLDFARIFELFLDADGNIARHLVHRNVRNLARVHEHADFTARLDRIRFFYAFERRRDAFQISKTLEIPLYRIAARARTAARDRIRDLHNHGLRRFIRIFLVVRLHRLNHFLIDAEFFENATAYFDMRARHFVIDGLADVMEERSGARDIRISAELGREHAGDLRLLDYFVDFRRLNAAVLDEFFERDLRDVAAQRIEGRKRDLVRYVIDKHVDARRALERLDVAPFLADYLSLHFFRGNGNGKGGYLRIHRAREAMDNGREDFARLPIEAIAARCFEFLEAREHGIFVRLLDIFNKEVARGILRKARHF